MIGTKTNTCSVAGLLLQLVCLSVQSTAAARGGTVLVASCPGGLLDALRDSTVTTIELVSDCSLAQIPDTENVPVNRNVTVTGPGGRLPVLDLGFVPEVVTLGPNAWLTVAGIAITRTRRSTGESFDSIVGTEEPGAVLVLQNVVKQRVACTPPQDTAAVLLETDRSSLVPNSTSGKQEFSLGTTTYRDTPYPDSLHMYDVSTDFPLVHVEGRVHHSAAGKQGHLGGLALWEKNVSHVCSHTVSAQCIAAKGAEACLTDFFNQLGAAPEEPGGARGANPAVTAAAVVVPVVVLGLLAAVVLVWIRRKSQQKQLLLQQAPDPVGKLRPLQPPYSVSFSSSKPGVAKGNLDSRLCHADSATEAILQKEMSVDVRNSNQQFPDSRPQVGGEMSGWEVACLKSCPFIGPISDSAVEFGELLGAGSFGRVYRARWAGKDVAVKVIGHMDTTTAVDAEAELLLSLNHPNLVRAYHYVTYTQQAPPLGPSTSSSSSQGSRMRAMTDKQAAAGAWGNTSDSAMEKANAGGRPGTGSDDAAAPALGADSLLSGAMQAAAINAAGALQVGAPSAGGCSHGSGGQLGLERSTTCSSSWQAKHTKAETWLVQEYCDRGTLSSCAAAWAPEAECEAQMLERLMLLLDAARGLAALHAECVVHGDLNARNVLVTSSANSPLGVSAKLADLGLSRTIKQSSHRTTHTVGTMSHTAPELLRSGRMSPAVDVYSFGVMMWELFTNQVAFPKLHYGQFFETVVLQKLRPLVPPEMPADYTALMKKCWSAEPQERPSAQHLVECLAALVSDRQAWLDGQGGDPKAMAAFTATLGLEPLELEQHDHLQAGVGSHIDSPAVVGSPAGSENSWRGFLQRDVAATVHDGLQFHPRNNSSAAADRAAGTGVQGLPQGSSAEPHTPHGSGYSSQGAQQGAELTGQLHETGGDSVHHQTRWFV